MIHIISIAMPCLCLLRYYENMVHYEQLVKKSNCIQLYPIVSNCIQLSNASISEQAVSLAR